MKSRIKKLITIALATTMLLGGTVTAHAAYCNHSPEPYSYSTPTSNPCGVHKNCKVTTTTYYSGLKCKLCNGVLSISPTHATVTHSNG